MPAQVRAKQTTKQIVSAVGAKAGAAVGATFGGAGAFVGRYIGSKLPQIVGKGKDLIAGGVAGIGTMALGITGAGLAGLPMAIGINMIIAVIAVPATIIFFFTIINTSALIVPPSSALTTFDQPPIIIGDFTCPLVGGIIRVPSYTSANGPYAHGTNRYWNFQNSQGFEDCRWSLPQFDSSCKGPVGDSASVCGDQRRLCPYYGYAADAFPGTTTVIVPSVNGENLTWNHVRTASNGSRGWTHIYRSGIYEITLTHLQLSSAPGTLQSGDIVGQLFPQGGGNTHLHIEFMVDGVFQKPEDFFCN